LPHAVATREVAELLSLDALRQALDARMGAALVDCRAAVNGGRSLDDEPATISQLVRIACVLAAVQDAQRVLRYGQPPAAEVEALQHLLEAEARAPILRTMARGERGGMHWVMSAATSGDLNLGTLPKDDPVVAGLKAIPTGLAARHAHAFLLRHLTRFVEISRLPEHRWPEAVRDWDRVARTAPNGARQLFPAVPKLVAACLRHRAAVRCAVAALAAERHRLQSGRWPDRLADLVPSGLTAMPIDPYDGRPLRYVRTADGVTVYALGPDGKDNGGDLDPMHPDRDGSDIGFRLWNASARHEAAARKKRSPKK
jgi:hypothetical protein